MVEVRGVLVRPPSLCCGGTVTVMGAVRGGAVSGMGSETEITTLVGAEENGLEMVGVVMGGNWMEVELLVAVDICCGKTTCGCGIVGRGGVGTTTGSCCGGITPVGTSWGSCWVRVGVPGFIMSAAVARGLNMLPYMLDMLYPMVAAIMFGVCLASCCCSSCCCRNGYMLPAVAA